ncbi:MAG TPA: LysR family transcriptional regulator [Desulfitobacterium dehalogenans]|uniref:LysR family transcriptional regulator n=1 Tax=Desulfitobacterium dehalogenans TaxID=36854 RepID=A0A7C7D6H8_9FIRM|nr:LysR family transcriptional regulator [Desulfitobacterium dehalogenans]
MELRNIITFLKVAEMRNFSKAAEKLGYSQSTITIQIQQLEKELGTQLFERIGKGVTLTEQGRAFIFHANEIIRVTNKAIVSAKANVSTKDTDVIAGTLRIGSVESVSTALLPDILLQFHHAHPKVEIVVNTSGRDALIDMVRNNTIDLFFTLEKKINAPGLKRTILREEEIIFVAPTHQAIPDKEKVKLEDIVNMPFLLTERGESYRYELERLLSDKDIEMKPILEISNTETIIHLVERGMGISFLPLFSAQTSIEKGKLSQIKTDIPAIYMWSQLFYHKNKWITPQMSAFISVAQDFFKNEGIGPLKLLD